MDAGQQSNDSDCGVLAIAFTLDICCGKDPCNVRFDHKSIRYHSAKCLEECKFTRFPILGERSSSGIKCVQKTELHCSCQFPEKVGVDQSVVLARFGTVSIAWIFHLKFFDNPDVPWKCKKCESL